MPYRGVMAEVYIKITLTIAFSSSQQSYRMKLISIIQFDKIKNPCQQVIGGSPCRGVMTGACYKLF